MERNLDFSEASITLDRSQALMIPLASSCSLLLMFYLFSSVSHSSLYCCASVMALFFCLSPYIAYAKSRLNLMDPSCRCCLVIYPIARIAADVLYKHNGSMANRPLLNNALGISICIAFVSHVRLPNIKICSLLLVCLFVYDVFWVFFSERFFGANVMVSVATQKASNPVHSSDKLSLLGCS
ncbi:hypothetical protein QYE76_030774 [Lolium multiflorum]|uniref:Uncharacterized protein n=1 Tax=Lolium multiflorum TaxID=4521 RepID=A0AAD8VJ45_LOLMU|nr:hypothetical protein QYE76_030774 [Lolium multiflorum]